ncbi:hypothetical protein H4R24_000782 [Coemansia sp. RSA 988]|nr:hypothetical protein H4R24_000782 [Coemansia sp. RSA 988]
MKTIQFVAVTTVALAAVASAQSAEKKMGDMSANQNTNSVSGASPNAGISSDPKAPKEDKPKAKAPAATNGAAKPAAGSDKKQAETKNTKERKSAKENISSAAPDANAASHQVAASAALLGAAMIAGAYI